MDDGRGTHHAGFERDVQGGTREPVAGQRASAGTQHLDLGMGGGIVTGDRPIRGHRQDGVPLGQHCADRHFAGSLGAARRFECDSHEINVTAQGHELTALRVSGRQTTTDRRAVRDSAHGRHSTSVASFFGASTR
jgi:hypothetical protein